MERSADVKKDIPTIFPLGFGVAKVEGSSGVIILDFIDRTGTDRSNFTVVGSFALTPERIDELISAINQARNN